MFPHLYHTVWGGGAFLQSITGDESAVGEVNFIYGKSKVRGIKHERPIVYLLSHY